MTGKVEAKFAAPGVLSHFDALSFLYSAGSWSPDAKQLAFVTYADGDNEINIIDVRVAHDQEAFQAEGHWRGDDARVVARWTSSSRSRGRRED